MIMIKSKNIFNILFKLLYYHFYYVKKYKKNFFFYVFILFKQVLIQNINQVNFQRLSKDREEFQKNDNNNNKKKHNWNHINLETTLLFYCC